MTTTDNEKSIQAIVDNFNVSDDKAKTIYESGMNKLQSDDETVYQEFVKEIQKELDIDEDDATDIADFIEMQITPSKEVKFTSKDENISFEISNTYGKFYVKITHLSNEFETEFELKKPFNKLEVVKATNRNLKDALDLVSNYEYDKDEIKEIISDFNFNFNKLKTQIENLESKEESFDKENDESDEDGNILDENGTIIDNNHKKYCGLYLPDGYYMHPNKDSEKYGVYDIKDKKICSVPTIVTGKGINLDGGDNYYVVTRSDYDEGKKEIIVKQSDILTLKGLSGLIDKGIRVDNFTMGDMTKYYKDAIDCNEGVMEKVNIVERSGWKKNNTMFAFGDKGYTANGIVPLFDKNDEDSPLQSKGSFEKWKVGIEPILNFRITRFKMYAAFAAPLLNLVSAANIIINHYFESTAFKTVSTQVSLSGLGNATSDGLTNSDTTLYAAEKTIYENNHLPVFFDEASRMNEGVKEKLIFLIGNGTTKSRGNPSGAGRYEKAFSFKCTTFLTGERPILTDESFDGEWVRTFDIYEGAEKNEANRQLAMNATIAMTDNYGFLAEPYINKLFEIGKDELINQYKETTKRIVNDNPTTNPFGGRVAQYMATIEIAGKMVEEILEDFGFMPMNVEAIINHYFIDKVKTNEKEKPYITRLNHFMDWFNMKKTNHFICDGVPNPFSSGDVLGRFDNNYIGVSRKVLDDALKQYDKGDMTMMLKKWRDEGIIIADKGAYTTKYHGVRVVKFNIAKINKVLGTNVDESEIKITYSQPKKLNLNFKP